MRDCSVARFRPRRALRRLDPRLVLFRPLAPSESWLVRHRATQPTVFANVTGPALANQLVYAHLKYARAAQDDRPLQHVLRSRVLPCQS